MHCRCAARCDQCSRRTWPGCSLPGRVMDGACSTPTSSRLRSCRASTPHAASPKVREQFGRPIGQFQGVKHKCADMLAETELARAAAWDAARAADEPAVAPLTAAAAASLAIDASYRAAKDCIQVHGGIGFTWKHDAHLYLKRAMVTRQLLGPTSAWRVRAAQAARTGTRRRLGVDLPPEAEAVREEVREFVAGVKGLEADEQRRRIADAGYLAPQWPKPWGRDAGALEQLVIDEEFRKGKARRANL